MTGAAEGAQQAVSPRGAIWMGVRFLTGLWATMAAFVMAIGIASPDTSIGIKLGALAVIAFGGFAPLLAHMKAYPSDWTRRRHAAEGSSAVQPFASSAPGSHRSTSASAPGPYGPFPLQHSSKGQHAAPAWRSEPAPPNAPLQAPPEPDGVYATLARIRAAADELVTAGVIHTPDHVGVMARADRLHDLVEADQRTVSLGGMVSPVLRAEVDALHRRLVTLLDASIDAKALAPGDGDLDARLQSHLDALHSHGAAVRELERPDLQAGDVDPWATGGTQASGGT